MSKFLRHRTFLCNRDERTEDKLLDWKSESLMCGKFISSLVSLIALVNSFNGGSIRSSLDQVLYFNSEEIIYLFLG